VVFIVNLHYYPAEKDKANVRKSKVEAEAKKISVRLRPKHI